MVVSDPAIVVIGQPISGMQECLSTQQQVDILTHAIDEARALKRSLLARTQRQRYYVKNRQKRFALAKSRYHQNRGCVYYCPCNPLRPQQENTRRAHERGKKHRAHMAAAHEVANE